MLTAFARRVARGPSLLCLLSAGAFLAVSVPLSGKLLSAELLSAEEARSIKGAICIEWGTCVPGSSCVSVCVGGGGGTCTKSATVKPIQRGAYYGTSVACTDEACTYASPDMTKNCSGNPY